MNPPKSDESPYAINILDLQDKLELGTSKSIMIQDIMALTLQDADESLIAVSVLTRQIWC
jgi:hypothetical protein